MRDELRPFQTKAEEVNYKLLLEGISWVEIKGYYTKNSSYMKT